MKKVLSRKELRVLLKVKTTPEEARQILEKFSLIITILGKNYCWSIMGYENVSIGCPHCATDASGTYLCSRCRYSIVPFKKILPMFPCTAALFGGYCYGSVSSVVELSCTGATVYRCADKSLVKAAIIWAKGHCEWAREEIGRAHV